MEYSSEEYTKLYIMEALFKLMDEYEYEKIRVTDIVKKAGVGRASFYRYFKRKEDIIIYYLEHNQKNFIFNQRFFPRCKEDYLMVAQNVFIKFKENKEHFKLIRKTRLEYLYLDYLNSQFTKTFDENYLKQDKFLSYLYSGMLFNVSMAWLDNDCKESVETLAEMVIDAIYLETK